MARFTSFDIPRQLRQLTVPAGAGIVMTVAVLSQAPNALAQGVSVIGAANNASAPSGQSVLVAPKLDHVATIFIVNAVEPCIGPHDNALRTMRSSVPCNRSTDAGIASALEYLSDRQCIRPP